MQFSPYVPQKPQKIDVPIKKGLVEDAPRPVHVDLHKHPSLGVIRLDYDYEAAPGDIDCPDSYGYDVYYRTVPGLTFARCQDNQVDDMIKRYLVEAIRYFEDKG